MPLNALSSVNISHATDLSELDTLFPIYIPKHATVIPVFALGFIINGVITATFLCNKSTLLVSRLDRIMLLLILVFLLWSAVCLVEFGINMNDLFEDNVMVYAGQAIVSSCGIVFIFGVNLLLAMERFCKVIAMSDDTSEKYFSGVIVVIGILCGIIIGIFTSSFHEMGGQKQLVSSWIIVMYVTTLVITVVILVLYIFTYFRSSRQVRECLGIVKENKKDSTPQNVLRVHIERRILINSMVMASSLIWCYLPGIVIQLIPSHTHLEDQIVFYDVSEVMLSLDVLITPVLILYFRADLRKVYVEFYRDISARVWRKQREAQILP
ncbi:hypothetical protein BDR26DRAFT_858656 [Obelidium mucronatum]|nr:hypothetical protein BDR26DRAFT_858656 [Obelidium mucronatum]